MVLVRWAKKSIVVASLQQAYLLVQHAMVQLVRACQNNIHVYLRNTPIIPCNN